MQLGPCLYLYVYIGFAFLLGSVVGSFLNVCIYRIPSGLSIVSPPSLCPICKKAIRWYQNVPIISYVLLGRRCGFCKVKIPVRYALVEVLTGGLFVVVLYTFGVSFTTLVYWLFVSALVVITFIDLDHQIIPDVISLPGIPLGFLCSFLVPWLSWSDSLLGILLGGGILYAVAWTYEIVAKREGMGGGDIKLLAMIGAFLGWKAVLPIIFFASLAGTIIGLPLTVLKKKDGTFALPFGPFLAGATLVYLFWGNKIISWYLGLYN